MSCIVYQTNKKTGIKYAYSSESYWDKEKQQPRSRRKYLGRVDPETGEIITGRTAKTAVSSGSTEIKELEDIIRQQKDTISSLQDDISVLQKKYRKAIETLRKIHVLTEVTEDGSYVCVQERSGDDQWPHACQ